MSEEINFKCEVCGKVFPADPDAMQEVHLQGQCPCCEEGISKQEAARLVAEGEAITAEQLAAMTPSQLAAYGLTEAERDALLRGENVAVGAACICKECQDKLVGES